MPSTPINTPAGYITQVGVAYASPDGSAALAVGLDSPLPIAERPLGSATPIVPGADQAPRRAVAIACTAPGTAVLKLADDSLFAVPLASGLSILPLAVKTVVTAGTTATASFTNLG